MKPNDYKFEIGDKVVTVYGEVGRIVNICTCDRCKARGFNEPEWVDEFGDKHFITNYMAEYGFDEFRQVGSYRFDHPFAREMVSHTIMHHKKMLNEYERRLAVINELDNKVD